LYNQQIPPVNFCRGKQLNQINLSAPPLCAFDQQSSGSLDGLFPILQVLAGYSLKIHENYHCRDQCHEGDRVVDGIDDTGNVVHAAEIRIVQRAVVVARFLQAAQIICLVVPGAVERAISRGVGCPERLHFAKKLINRPIVQPLTEQMECLRWIYC
jgi:hypothetical protein